MRISDLLSVDSIIFLNVKDKEELFEKISEILAEKTKNIKSSEILTLLEKREEMGSTYAGKDTAIPHIKCKKLENFYFYLFILEDKIIYDDEKNVKNIFFIAGPDKNYSFHLTILSRIARMLKETDILNEINKKREKGQILNSIKEAENKII